MTLFQNEANIYKTYLRVITSQNDTVPKQSGGRIRANRGVITSQNDTVPKLTRLLLRLNNRVITSQNDTVPKL